MTNFEVAIWAVCVGGILSIVGILIGSWLTQRLERRQQVWQAEINRIIDLEERAGILVELICSHRSIQDISDGATDGLSRLASDAGRFRRHEPIMQAVRDLHIRLACVIDEKQHCEDPRETIKEVDKMYKKLLAACDKVTGKRRI